MMRFSHLKGMKCFPDLYQPGNLWKESITPTMILKNIGQKNSRVPPAVRLGGILVCNLSASGFKIGSMKGEPSDQVMLPFLM